MKIAIIGASAGIGLATVKRALELGNSVTTLSRSKVELPANPNMVNIEGSALNKADFNKAIVGVDAILVTLGTGSSRAATTLCSDFAKMISTMEIKVPVIIVSAFGTRESFKYLPAFFKLFFKIVLRRIIVDKATMEEIIEKSNLQWEIVRPGVLTDKPLSENYVTETVLSSKIVSKPISRADVADYLVKEAMAQKNLGKFVSQMGK